MNLLVLSVLCSVALAAPQGYNLDSPSTDFQHSASSPPAPVNLVPCPKGLVRHFDGECIAPKVNRNVFIYQSPSQDFVLGPAPDVPVPQLDYNIVFVRSPEQPEPAEPIVVPPPQQKTIVYVLSKSPDISSPEIIEVPYTPTQPEVHYVSYRQGENPQLPGGVDLQSALSSTQQQQGQFIGAAGGAGGAGGAGAGGAGRQGGLSLGGAGDVVDLRSGGASSSNAFRSGSSGNIATTAGGFDARPPSTVYRL